MTDNNHIIWNGFDFTDYVDRNGDCTLNIYVMHEAWHDSIVTAERDFEWVYIGPSFGTTDPKEGLLYLVRMVPVTRTNDFYMLLDGLDVRSLVGLIESGQPGFNHTVEIGIRAPWEYIKGQ